jgi:DGQHR domain-containing protein
MSEVEKSAKADEPSPSEFDSLVSVDSVLEQDRKNRQALLILMDAQRERKNHIFAMDVRMGVTRSFVTSVSLEWLAQRVRFATELPMFKEYKDPETGKIRLDRETAAMIQQREPNWTRQFPMTLYLAKRRRHKFPPLLLVATQDWVDEPASDEWGGNGQALKDSVNAQSLDSLGTYVDLHLTEKDLLYAIDGQHRLMAVKGLTDLLNNGKIFARDDTGKQRALSVSIDEIIEQSKGEVSRTHLQQLLAERIGVEIIPAVLKGETRKEALRRIRSIFVHVNRTAVALTKGEIAQLDEDDGFAVVARLVAFSHPLLKDRVHLKKGQLPTSSDDITTLETLVTVCSEYLRQFEAYADWLPDSKTEMSLRPEEESLDAGYTSLSEYFTCFAEIPSYKRILQGKSPKEVREAEGNLLFRPMAQIALAEALGSLIVNKQRKLPHLIEVLSSKEKEGMLNYKDPKTPWHVVIWDPNRETMERSASAQKLCTRLLIHVLGGGTPDDNAYEDLRKAFAQARIVDREKKEALDLKGQRVSPDKVELPTPW